MSSPNDWNNAIIEEFRSNGGKVSGQFAGMPLLLLTTTGARSGQARVNPLAYLADGDRYVIVASKGGAPTNPDWYYNLVATPTVEVEVGTEKFAVRARVVEGAEREELWQKMVAQSPGFGAYVKKTTRQIPVVVLEHS